MKTQIRLKVPVSILREGKYFVAYTPVLDLSTSGKSFAIVQRRFAEAVQIFFEELMEAGTTDEVLSDLGWKKIRSQWIPPMPVSHELADISIPLKN